MQGEQSNSINCDYRFLNIDGIPVIEFRPASPVRSILFVCHGFSSSKNQFLEDAELVKGLLQKGFMVIAPDNSGHGDRKGSSFKDRAFNESIINIFSVREMIDESANDISKLIDHYEGLGFNTPFGITGISMGGFVSFKTLVNDYRVICAAPMIGSPVWEDVPSEKGIPPHMNIDRSDEAMNKLKRYSDKNSPHHHLNAFKGKRLLAQNGQLDAHVHIKHVQSFFSALNQVPGSKAELIVYPDLYHETNHQMIERVIRFFDENMN